MKCVQSSVYNVYKTKIKLFKINNLDRALFYMT